MLEYYYKKLDVWLKKYVTCALGWFSVKTILEVKKVTKIYKVYKSNTDRLKELFSKKKYHKEYTANNTESKTKTFSKTRWNKKNVPDL